LIRKLQLDADILADGDVAHDQMIKPNRDRHRSGSPIRCLFGTRPKRTSAAARVTSLKSLIYTRIWRTREDETGNSYVIVGAL
jgi:hypothetical protein